MSRCHQVTLSRDATIPRNIEKHSVVAVSTPVALEDGSPENTSNPVKRHVDVRLGFVFTGQGAQWHAMGRELLTLESYRNSLDRANQCLQDLGCEWSLTEELNRGYETSRIDDSAYSLPISTAVQLALVDLLRGWNVSPMAVIGHSSSEMAAAYCAGAITFASAMKIAYFGGSMTISLRNRQQHENMMMCVSLSAKNAQPFIQRIEQLDLPGILSVACHNAPQNITVAGSRCKIDALESLLRHEGHFVLRFPVNMAYHISAMEDGMNEYTVGLGQIEGRETTSNTPIFYSSLKGSRADTKLLSGAQYWIDSLVYPVLFSEAATEMLRDNDLSINYLIEVGPQSVMRPIISEIITAAKPTQVCEYGSLLVRDKSADATILECMSKLHDAGYDVDLNRISNL